MSMHLTATAVVFLTAAVGIAAASERLAPADDAMPMVTVAGGAFDYRVSGEFLRDGVPVDAPLERTAFDRGVTIMARQVSAAEYARCVADRACSPAAEHEADASLPVVGVSWIDANAYAAWLSRQTGDLYRLPTDAEWAYVAGDRFSDDALAVAGDPSDPAKRWLAAYEKESAETNATDPTPRAFGTFGTNRNGLSDLAGNVWEWTSTCYVRHAVHSAAADTAVENCGVRVVEGAHRTYLSDFIRNPRGGACSVGVPPSNLGIRLVRDDDPGVIAPLVHLARRFGLAR
jgi:formylglycine-generating enzyme required for sulfatase activity